MVARINNEMFTQELFTPRPEVSDSDDLLLALETARVLETQGEIREAARWLRRAADEAERQGNDERVLTLARAAADLANTLPAPSAADVPTMPPPAYTSTMPPPESAEATIPPAGSLVETLPPMAPTPTVSTTSDMPLTERSGRIAAIRVAIAEGSIRGVKSFAVERLERGQEPPEGTREAMLVFSGEIDGAELDAVQRAEGDSSTS